MNSSAWLVSPSAFSNSGTWTRIAPFAALTIVGALKSSRRVSTAGMSACFFSMSSFFFF